MGRPSKLTDELTQEICDLVAIGTPSEKAAEARGLGRTTFFTWMQKGEAEESGKYADFRHAIIKARASAIGSRLRIIEDVAAGGQVIERKIIKKKDGSEEVLEKLSRPNWTAAAWLLERTYPEHFGRTDRTAGTDSASAQLEDLLKRLNNMNGNDTYSSPSNS